MSKEDGHKLAESYDIFLNTTSIDNHPVSVIEAMALGLPIVSTDAGGLTYLLKDNEDSLLTHHYNFEKLCSNIDFLIKNPNEAKRLAANARKKVEHFDWKYIENSYHQLMAN
ncbi:MAG: glycosyltransferase family 4 protein [Bacteroidetes bacterium]|nr:glycosyltransferase family 4 protein [Bacteroidota bacterium]